MPGFLYHVGAQAMCPHGGQITTVSSNAKVLVAGQPVATVADTSLVAGCAFAPVQPQPCVRVQWLAPAVKVLVVGQPALLQTSPGLCLSAEQIPQGAPIPISGQVKVQGT